MQWLAAKKIDAVVWTGLPSNFESKTGKKFAVKDALTYLAGLPPEGKALAAEYIWRAPDFIEMPLRTAVEVAPWFTVRPVASPPGEDRGTAP